MLAVRVHRVPHLYCIGNCQMGISRIESNKGDRLSLEGSLLIASPRLEDAVFGRSVCLVVEHTEKAVAGVVLNRPVISDVLPLWKQLTDGCQKTAEPPRHLHFGGPVSGPVVAVHDQETLADAGNGQGVYLAAQVDTLKKLVFIAPEHYRLVVGHAAWEATQLVQQIQAGLWYVLPASPELVFSADEEMWTRGIRRAVTLILQHLSGAKHVFENPQHN